jgi:uracil-DNA glycosylase
MQRRGDILRDFAAKLRALLTFQGELGLNGLAIAPKSRVAPLSNACLSASDPVAKVASTKVAHSKASPLASRITTTSPSFSTSSTSTSTSTSTTTTTSSSSSSAPSAPSAPSRTPYNLSPALAAILTEIGDCQRCKLHQARTHIVFGVGNPNARLLFIGEGPGRDEDLQGEPFVGAAGQLLDRMIKAMGLTRQEVYIANIVKCRPPGNRDPEPDEVAACTGFLKAQIRALHPETIVVLGRVAAQTLLGETTPISRLRGKWREYESVPIMPTFHPAYLLRNPSDKRLVWEDLQAVMQRLALTPPK